jgi:regulator of protease activity HflC (stomatin/prohibitin superfamily)
VVKDSHGKPLQTPGIARGCEEMHTMEGLGLVFFGFVVIVALIIFFGSFFTVDTQQVAIVQRLGKFEKIAQAGINFKLPIIDTVVHRMSLRVEQLIAKIETKTQDNVFVTIPVAIQYRVLPEKVYDAYYRLTDPERQIESYVYNGILGHVPKMKLDDAFENQGTIADDVKALLDTSMKDFGYEIVKVLVTDIVPDAHVKEAMNDINAAQRERDAASAKADADKIIFVKKAEAEAESKKLQGEGIANQRKAIIGGLQESVEALATATKVDPREVFALVMMTQYFDTLKDIASNDRTNTILVPHTPNAISDLMTQFRNAVAIGTELSKHDAPPPSGN